MAYQPKSYRKFLAGTITAAVVASAVAPAALAAETKFKDLSSVTDPETLAAIEALVEVGVIVGFPDGTFKPNQTINNSQAAEMIVKALPNVEPKATPTGGVFEDLTAKSYTSKFAEALVDAKLWPAGGKFGPVAGMTREKMAVLLVKATGLTDNGTAVEITDIATLSAESQAAIKVLAQHGLTKVLDGKFNPNDSVTRSQFALFFTRAAAAVVSAPEVTEIKSVNETTLEVKVKGSLTTVDTADFTFDGGLTVTAAEIVPAAAAETFTTVKLTTSKQEAGKTYKLLTFKGAEVKTEVKVEVPTIAVAGASVPNAKTLKVDLKSKLDSVEGLTFTVKRGTTTIVLTPKLSEDKLSVELSSATNLVAGDYTVVVTGGKFVEGTNSAAVTVAAQKVSKIEVLSTNAVLSATTNDTVSVGYVVKDQYGTDITKDALAANINWSSSVGTATDNNAGKVTIDKNAEIKKGDTIVVTAVNPSTGTTAVATLTVSDAAALQSLTFGAIKYPVNKTRVEANVAIAADLEVTGLDQYGNAVDTAATLNAATTIIDSDAFATATFVVVDGKSYLRLNTVGVTSAKPVIVTVVIKATGQTVNYTFDVVKASEAAEVVVTAPTTTVANGDTAGALAATLSVKDQFGTDLTVNDIAGATSAYTITSSNSLVIPSGSLEIATSGTNKGKLVNSGAFVGAGQTTITVTVNATGKSSSFLLDVKAAREAATIELPTTLVGHLVQGATTSTKLSFKDQYAAAYDATGNIADRAVKVSVSKVSGDDAGLSVTVAGQTTTGDVVTVTNESAVDASAAFTIDAVSGKKGSYTVTFQYVNTANNDEVLSQVSKTFVVAENVSTGLTYAVADLPTLYKGGSALDSTTGNISTVDVNAGYAKELSITATDASGNAYVIPTSSIVSVTSNNANIIVQNVDGEWYVAGNNSAITSDVTGQVAVVINTNDGVRTITKEVKVSSQALVAQSVTVKNAAPGVTTATDLSTLTLTAGTTTFDTAKVWVADQFGGYSLAADGFDEIRLVNLVGDAVVTGSTVTYNAGTGMFTLNGLSTPVATDKFRVIIIEDGQSDFVDITLN
jgi:hypothetical protein